MSFILGELCLQKYLVLDGADLPLTGVTSPAGVALYLHRQSGSTMIAASEAMAWTEIGVTGHYYISFTPLNTGLYILELHELHALSTGRWFRFEDILVYTAGAIQLPSYSNAFCSEADIEAWVGHAISSLSTPNDTQAAEWAEERASQLMSICARHGFAVTPASVVAGSRIEDLLRRANAIGAALDYTVAQQLGNRESLSVKAERLLELWVELVGDGTKENPGVLVTEVKNNASLATNHILSGDTLAAPVGAPPTDSGVGPITMGSLY